MAKIALGVGMKVIASDKFVGDATIKVEFYNGQFININIETEPMDEVLKHSDFITLHVPAQKGLCHWSKTIRSDEKRMLAS